MALIYWCVRFAWLCLARKTICLTLPGTFTDWRSRRPRISVLCCRAAAALPLSRAHVFRTTHSPRAIHGKLGQEPANEPRLESVWLWHQTALRQRGRRRAPCPLGSLRLSAPPPDSLKAAPARCGHWCSSSVSRPTAFHETQPFFDAVLEHAAAEAHQRCQRARQQLCTRRQHIWRLCLASSTEPERCAYLQTCCCASSPSNPFFLSPLELTK